MKIEMNDQEWKARLEEAGRLAYAASHGHDATTLPEQIEASVVATIAHALTASPWPATQNFIPVF